MSARRPNVYLVGAGPGDPGLVTLRARELIERADILLYDRLINPAILGWARPDCERVYVGKNPRRSGLTQQAINAILVDKGRTGRCIVRLKGGDPFVFGRGGEEAEALLAAGLSFEIVPGITSAVAAPAYAGIPITHREAGSMVTLVAGHESPEKERSSIDFRLLVDPRLTVVFLMSLGNLAANLRALVEAGRDPETPAALVSRATYPHQRTLLGTVNDLARRVESEAVHGPAALIVGQVAGLHRTLHWFESRALHGRRIVLTREADPSARLSRRLAELGADPVIFPTIAITECPMSAEIQSALAHLDQFDWVVFTSGAGVRAFFHRLAESGRDSRALGGRKIAAVGPRTAEALSAVGLRPEIQPAESNAVALADALHKRGALSERFLFPCAESAREELEDAVARAGGSLRRVVVYQTRLPPVVDEDRREAIRAQPPDAVVFTSVSTANHFHRLMGADFHPSEWPTLALAIGATTRAELERQGWRRVVQSASTDESALVEALLSSLDRDDPLPDQD